MKGQERWKAANEKLDRALQTYTNKMNDSMQFVVHDLTANIQAKYNRGANELSNSCKTHLIEAHHRREHCLKTLQTADRNSKLAFKSLIARTLDEAQPAAEDNHEGISEVSPL